MENYSTSLIDLKVFKNLTDIISEHITLPLLSKHMAGAQTILEIVCSIARKDAIDDADQQLLYKITNTIEEKLSSAENHDTSLLLEEIAFLTVQLLASLPAPLEGYQKDAIVALSRLSVIRGKVVLEVGADLHLAVAKALIMLGAEKVIAMNPAIPQDYKSPDQRIVLLRQSLEELEIGEERVDALLGIAILEHINNPCEFAAQCKRLLKNDGSLLLTGGPMWTSHGGHHLWLPNLPSGRQYYFHIKGKNPFEPWEHLNFENQLEAEQALINKNIPDEDIPFILEQLFLNDHISRLSPTAIENVFRNIFGDTIKFGRWKPYDQKNKYFFKALGKYSQEDLLSWALIISKSSYHI